MEPDNSNNNAARKAAEVKLLDCPVHWCKGHGKLRKSPVSEVAFVECDSCDCWTGIMTTEEAINLWNNRVDLKGM